jgi:hypothetical protein
MGDICSCSLNLEGISDLTTFLHLPKPGQLRLHCVATTSLETILAHFQAIHAEPEKLSTLHLLPAAEYSDRAIEHLQRLCAENHCAVALNRLGKPSGLYWLQEGHAPKILPNEQRKHPKAPLPPLIDFGPARIIFAPKAALYHPEPMLAAAKQGCDVVVSSDRCLSPIEQLLAGTRTIDNLAVAVCTPHQGGIWMTPEGHQRWEEYLTGGDATCRYLLDTNRTRKKRFQDRVDYEVLLTDCPDGVPPAPEK